MISFFLSVWLAISSFFGLVPMDESISSIDYNSEEMSPPAVTPNQSAPIQALDACIDKQEKQNCSFSLSNQNLNGLCQPSGKQLACTPMLPE